MPLRPNVSYYIMMHNMHNMLTELKLPFTALGPKSEAQSRPNRREICSSREKKSICAIIFHPKKSPNAIPQTPPVPLLLIFSLGDMLGRCTPLLLKAHEIETVEKCGTTSSLLKNLLFSIIARMPVWARESQRISSVLLGSACIVLQPE